MLTKKTVALPKGVAGKGGTAKAVVWKKTMGNCHLAGGGYGAAIGSSMGIPYLFPIITVITVAGVGYFVYRKYKGTHRSTW